MPHLDQLSFMLALQALFKIVDLGHHRGSVGLHEGTKKSLERRLEALLERERGMVLHGRGAGPAYKYWRKTRCRPVLVMFLPTAGPAAAASNSAAAPAPTVARSSGTAFKNSAIPGGKRNPHMP